MLHVSLLATSSNLSRPRLPGHSVSAPRLVIAMPRSPLNVSTCPQNVSSVRHSHVFAIGHDPAGHSPACSNKQLLRARPLGSVWCSHPCLSNANR